MKLISALLPIVLALGVAACDNAPGPKGDPGPQKPVLRVLLVPPVLREARGDQVLQASLGQRERPPNRLR
jgi:hypothetical protein